MKFQQGAAGQLQGSKRSPKEGQEEPGPPSGSCLTLPVDAAMKLVSINRAPTACQVLSSQISDMPTKPPDLRKDRNALLFSPTVEMGVGATLLHLRCPCMYWQEELDEYEGISNQKKKGPSVIKVLPYSWNYIHLM